MDNCSPASMATASTHPAGEFDSTHSAPRRSRLESFASRVIRRIKNAVAPINAQSHSSRSRNRSISNPVNTTNLRVQIERAYPGSLLELRETSQPTQPQHLRWPSVTSIRGRLDTPVSGEPSNSRIVRPELERACRVAVQSGFVKGFVGQGHPACKHPHSDKVFRDIVLAFNDIMGGLFERFRDLKSM